jgi:hypothetical protein
VRSDERGDAGGARGLRQKTSVVLDHGLGSFPMGQ